MPTPTPAGLYSCADQGAATVPLTDKILLSRKILWTPAKTQRKLCAAAAFQVWYGQPYPQRGRLMRRCFLAGLQSTRHLMTGVHLVFTCRKNDV